MLQSWALGHPVAVKILSSSSSARRSTVGRREELGFESRGFGFAFPLHQQLPRLGEAGSVTSSESSNLWASVC